MAYEPVVHVSVLTSDMQHPAHGSIRMRCETCHREMWIDPLTCTEMLSPHEHRCFGCSAALMLQPDCETRVTRGTMRRAREHLRRN